MSRMKYKDGKYLPCVEYPCIQIQEPSFDRESIAILLSYDTDRCNPVAIDALHPYLNRPLIVSMASKKPVTPHQSHQ